MEYIGTEVKVTTPVQASVEKILSEMGVLKAFYSRYHTDFYLIIEKYDRLGARLIIERSGKQVSLIHDFKFIKMGKGRSNSPRPRDVEFIFELPSWKPVSMAYYRPGHHLKDFTTIGKSNVYPKYRSSLGDLSKVWKDNFHPRRWLTGNKYEYGYKRYGKWFRARGVNVSRV